MHAALTQSTTLAATAVAATRATTSKTTRRSLVIMNNSSGPKRGTKSAPAQRAVGYKGSTDAGSAPKTRSGKANVDEYSPIWVPQDFKSDGDKYEGNLVYW